VTVTITSDSLKARRAAERRTAICTAVFELLGEVGYDRMTMDAVAARAHASKATIYRTWPDKPDLVAETLAQRFAEVPETPDTGSLRGDLLAMLDTACEMSKSVDGDVVAGVMTAAAHDPELSSTLHRYLYESKRVVPATLLDRAVRRGDVAPGTDPELLHEVLTAMVLTRRLLGCAQLDEDFARHVVDDVLIPVLTHRAR
jgi:AcrR family transcriptional regulator